MRVVASRACSSFCWRPLAPASPFDGLRTAPGSPAEPSTVTEFFPGAYRVTKCDAAGRARSSTTMARIARPPAARQFVPDRGGRRPAPGSSCSMATRRRRRWAAAWRRGRRRREPRVRPLRLRRCRRTSTSAPRLVDDGLPEPELHDVQPLARARPTPTAPTPAPCRRSSARPWIRGHQAWDRTRNSCGYRDQRQHHVSLRRVSVSIQRALAGRRAQRGRRRGACPGSAAARWTLACTWTFSGRDGRLAETDQRYGSAWRWSTTGRAGTYDIESAAAHETGHSIGLGHANASRFLTMYHQICSGCQDGADARRGGMFGGCGSCISGSAWAGLEG